VRCNNCPPYAAQPEMLSDAHPVLLSLRCSVIPALQILRRCCDSCWCSGVFAMSGKKALHHVCTE
jgi:hypothetical protein